MILVCWSDWRNDAFFIIEYRKLNLEQLDCSLISFRDSYHHVNGSSPLKIKKNHLFFFHFILFFSNFNYGIFLLPMDIVSGCVYNLYVIKHSLCPSFSTYLHIITVCLWQKYCKNLMSSYNASKYFTWVIHILSQ